MNIRQKNILLFATTCPKENPGKVFFLQNLPRFDFPQCSRRALKIVGQKEKLIREHKIQPWWLSG